MRAAALALLLVTLAACSPPATTTTSTSTSTAAVTSAPAPKAPETVTPEGFEGIHIGMTLANASTVVGHDIQPDGNDEDSGACLTFHTSATDDPTGQASFMAENGKVTRVSFDETMINVHTPEGVGVGSTDAEVRAAYPHLNEQPAKYDDPPAHDLIVWTHAHSAGYRFEIGADGKVNALHAGGASILYVEGCS